MYFSHHFRTQAKRSGELWRERASACNRGGFGSHHAFEWCLQLTSTHRRQRLNMKCIVIVASPKAPLRHTSTDWLVVYIVSLLSARVFESLFLCRWIIYVRITARTSRAASLLTAWSSLAKLKLSWCIVCLVPFCVATCWPSATVCEALSYVRSVWCSECVYTIRISLSTFCISLDIWRKRSQLRSICHQTSVSK